jgi:hypothetical protein
VLSIKLKVSKLPACRIHASEPVRSRAAARYHAYIPILGKWAYVCEHCFKTYRCELGLTRGMKLVLRKKKLVNNEPLREEPLSPYEQTLKDYEKWTHLPGEFGLAILLVLQLCHIVYYLTERRKK